MTPKKPRDDVKVGGKGRREDREPMMWGPGGPWKSPQPSIMLPLRRPLIFTPNTYLLLRTSPGSLVFPDEAVKGESFLYLGNWFNGTQSSLQGHCKMLPPILIVR